MVHHLSPPGASGAGPAHAILTVGLIAGPMIFANAMATVLVVKSSGPSSGTYKPGRALPDNAKVALQPADVLVVLAAESKRTFHGPGTFNLADAGAGSQAPTAVHRGRFSALRSAGIVPRSPTLWHVDVSQSGKFCLTDKSNVMLWRPEATDAVTLTVSGAGGSPQKIDVAGGTADAGVAERPAGERPARTIRSAGTASKRRPTSPSRRFRTRRPT